MIHESIITLEHISTGYPSKHGARIVAEDVNASIYTGQLTCLLGVNGVGKSTLLRTLSALQPALSGKTFIQGMPLSSYSDKQLSKIISVVLTERCDLRNMSVMELTGLGRSPYTGFWGKLSKNDIEIVNESLELVGINTLRNRMIHTLSDGERQKVMIAKALAQQTPIIFLDEPTAFLDYPSKVEIMQLLHSLSHKYRKTIFLSTHDLELALQIADMLWLMDKDNRLKIGTPEDLSINGTLETFFNRKGIKFDNNTGLFKVVNNIKRQIHMDGDGILYNMAQKALHRNGIEAGQNMKSPDAIICTETGFTYHTSGNETKTATNIEELLDIVIYTDTNCR